MISGAAPSRSPTTTKLSSLLAGLPARREGGGDVDVAAVTIDSRKAGPGVLFVACPGATPQSRDGHDFIGAAVAAGCAAVVCSDRSRAAAAVDKVPIVVVDDARAAAAVLAERAAGRPSEQLQLIGITGTNGKSTTTFLLAQLCTALGRRGAVVGTLGVGAPGALRPLGYTTPEAEVLSAELARLHREGFDVVAMETSSHALATKRVEGVRFAAAAFTNLTRDHLDFHGTMDAYFEAKARLFVELLGDRPAIVPYDDDADGYHARLRALLRDRPITRWGKGSGADVRLVSATLSAAGVSGVVDVRGVQAPFSTPLLGDYNVENLLVAVACATALGFPARAIADALAQCSAPPGRLQRVGGGDDRRLVVVDYAHSPDALLRALHVVRSVTAGKLAVVVGCGGDRDAGKRPMMGRIAAEVADLVVLTDDNPRSEDGGAIVEQMAAGIGTLKVRTPPAELDVGRYAVERSRRMAIRTALAALGDGDALLVAGKGHEQTQTIGARVLPFDDVAECARALAGKSSPAFLDGPFVQRALAGRSLRVVGTLPDVLCGVSTDTRAVADVRHSLFVALAGETHDGHAYLDAARAAGARALLVHDADNAGAGPAFIVDDTLAALQDLARAHLRSLPGHSGDTPRPAARIALTGSNGKTTTKELIAACLRACLGEAYVLATEGNLNNHIGVPLTALRAEPEHRALVFEMGMNHLGEIALLADIVRPQVGLVTNMGTAHAGNVGGIEGVARAKAELFEALGKDAVAVVNADDPRCVRESQQKAKCRHLSFGKAPWADVRLVAVRDRETGGQELELCYGQKTVETSIPLEGSHNAQNAAGAVAVAIAIGLPFVEAALGLPRVRGAHGRLERARAANGAVLLDDTYNANPDSMEAALSTLKELAHGRRTIAVLGEMRELGAFADEAHRHVGAAAAQAGVALLAVCGSAGKLYGEGAVAAGLSAHDVLWAEDNRALGAELRRVVQPNDVVLIKGSRGARMEVVVDALRSTTSATATTAPTGGHA